MRIMYAIRESDSENEIYQLLNAYIEAIQLDGEPCDPCAQTTHARIRGTSDLMQQITALIDALGAASRRLDDHSRLLIKEALHVFCAAADRIELLHRAAQPPVHAPHADAVRHASASAVIPDSSPVRGKNSSAVSRSGAMVKFPREGTSQLRNL
jgi:hypothetical protein